MDSEQLRQTRLAIDFATEDLGPASSDLMARPESQARVLARVRAGFRLEDAVLAEVHRGAGSDRALADEFVAHFLRDMLRVGSGALSEALRRYLDTGDLVQSVLGDLWTELAAVRFESRARYVGLLGQRLRWKASDHARRLAAQRRSEGRRVAGSPEDLELEAAGAGPATVAADRECRDRLLLSLARLPGRDRRIVEILLRGGSSKEVADELGLSREAARKALQRALRRAGER